MNKVRVVAFCAVVAAGIALMILFFRLEVRTAYESTLSPAFSVLGLATKSFNRVLTRVIPVDGLDEKQFGEAIAARYAETADLKAPGYRYLNELITALSQNRTKPFGYRVFVIDSVGPNAFALPGGVILVTRELLGNMVSESELVSILSHEMGHIELSHAFDKVRFELLSRKTGTESLGWLADFAINSLLESSYSKTVEEEADAYAYAQMVNGRYDPAAYGNALENLLRYDQKHLNGNDDRHANVLRDYFSSHPPLKIRIERFTEAAKAWWKLHPQAERYVGRMNLKDRVPFHRKDFGMKEWRKGKVRS